MAIILTIALLLTLLPGLVYHILGIQAPGFFKALSYLISSYGLPALGIILLFIVKLDGKIHRN
jgi:hypothetical protein